MTISLSGSAAARRGDRVGKIVDNEGFNGLQRINNRRGLQEIREASGDGPEIGQRVRASERPSSDNKKKAMRVKAQR